MPAVQIRDFPQEQYDLLCQSAKANGRSINQQLKFIATEYLRTAYGSSLFTQDSVDQTSVSAIEARRAKREELFARINSRTYPTFPPSMDTATIVSNMRAER